MGRVQPGEGTPRGRRGELEHTGSGHAPASGGKIHLLGIYKTYSPQGLKWQAVDTDDIKT